MASLDHPTVADWRERIARSHVAVAIGAVVLAAEFLVVVVYLSTAAVQANSIGVYIYPFVWINVGLLALWRTFPVRTTSSQRRVALLVAGGYLLVLSVAGGIVSPGHILHGHAHGTGFRVAALPPGWGPALVYGGAYLNLSLIPFRVFGYLVLAALVYATVVDAAGALLSSVVGLFSCVSCTFPVLAALASGLFGGSSALAVAVYAQSYALSTAVFVLTVGLLVWRPSISR